MDGAASLDFDRIETEADKVLPLSFDVAEDSKSFPTYVGAKVEKDYTATYADKRSDGKTLHVRRTRSNTRHEIFRRARLWTALRANSHGRHP